MAAIQLAAVSIDTDDPAGLGAFYRELLDLQVMWESPDFVALGGAGVVLTMQRVAEYRAPDWPAGQVPKQLHLELAVEDLDATQAQAVALGARVADEQPRPDGWRVLYDPSGHPFCLSAMRSPDL